MSNSAEILCLRRQLLLLKIQSERLHLIQNGKQLRISMAPLDVGIAFAKKIKLHPAVYLALSGALLVFSPKRFFSAAKTGFAAWQIWQRVAPICQRSCERTSAFTD